MIDGGGLSGEFDLARQLADHKIDVPRDQIEILQRYCQLLWSWNEKLNLTRHTSYEQFATRDVFDSLQLASLLGPREKVLDVGTGGGMPGILLAILRPDLKLSVCESVGKKARAVQAMIEELQLPVRVYGDRAEVVLRDHRFDALVARAIGPLPKMLRWFQPHWSSIGRLLAVKGPNWLSERKAARERGLLRDLQLRKAAQYTTPGTRTENVILKIWRDFHKQ